MPRPRLRELTYDEAGYQLWCFATDHGLPPEFSAGAFIRACQAKKLSPSKALELGKANIRSTER